MFYIIVHFYLILSYSFLMAVLISRLQGEGNVFTGVCLYTIGHMATRSLLILVTVWSVHILLGCFLVYFIFKISCSSLSCV